MTPGKKQKIRFYKTLLAASGGLVLTLTLLYAYAFGFTSISLQFLIVIVSLFWLGNFIFLGLIALNINLKFRDPAMTLHQMYWAASTSLGTLIMINGLDMLIYVLILVVFVFGILRVGVRDFIIFSVFAFLAFIGVELYKIPMGATQKDVFELFLKITVVAFSTVGMTSICVSVVKLKNRLKEKNEELEEALKTKQMFLANMSHELRTPLNGVIGMLSVAERKSNVPESVIDNIRIAKASANSLHDIICDILDFSKLDVGKLEVIETSFNIHNLIENICRPLSVLLVNKDVTFIVLCDPNIPTDLCGDPNRIKQIINNLVTNAIKFTEQGYIKISVNWDCENTTLHISVEDSGIGIEEALLDVLFESFSQADSSTTRKYGGTGLGLTITKSLVELLGGDIRVSSKVEKGSQFEVLLPSVSVAQTKQQLEIEKGLVIVIAMKDNDVVESIVSYLAFGKVGYKVFKSIDEITFEHLALERGVVLVDESFDESCYQKLVSRIGSGVVPVLFSSKEEFQLLGKPCFSGYQLMSPPFTSHSLSLLGVKWKENHVKPVTPKPIEKNVKDEGGDVILLVDDNQTNRQVAELLLEDFGVKFIEATNGEEAYTQYIDRHKTISLILMDCQMPVMDGYEATQKIREWEKKQQGIHIPIIAMTANAMSHDRQLCLDAGMDDYLAKPIDPTLFDQALSKWINTEKVVEHVAKSEPLDEEWSSGTWDYKAIYKRVGKKPERIKKLVKMFLDDFPIREERLLVAVNSLNYSEIASEAHGLKGASANLSLLKIYEFMVKLEKAGKKQDEEALSSLTAELERVRDESVSVLNQFLNSSV